MSKLKVISDDLAQDNTYLDSRLVIKALLGLGIAASPAQVSTQAIAANYPIHVETVEPLDADMPVNTLVLYMDMLGPNFRVMAKHKDGAGVTRTGPLGLIV